MSFRIPLVASLALSSLVTFVSAQEAESVVFADSFAYSGWDAGASPMNAVWSKTSGSNPSVGTGAPFATDVTYLKPNNAVAGAPLAYALDHDFELSFDALHTHYSRLLWVGLFNDEGTQGYAATWDSSSPGAWGSQGTVRIRKFSVTNPADLLFNTPGVQLGNNTSSGHNAGNTTNAATTAPFARFRLTWTKDTGALSLYVNGLLRQTVTDGDFSRFSRVVVSGFSGAMLDNILVRLPVGAAMPFITHEAESPANTVVGTRVTLDALPSAATHTPELEASGRAYVRLAQTGDHLLVPVLDAANRLVLRHCIPDTPAGGGIEATLNLHVNGIYRQTLALSSKHNWLYGDPLANGQSNIPSSGAPHVFWTESRHVIEDGLNPGDILGLHKDADNAAAYYAIDLLDLEQAPPPDAPPPNHVNVRDHGAVGDGLTDDTDALAAAIALAKQHGKTVWLSPGTYLQSRRLTLDGVALRGAGMWHTSILGTMHGTTWAGNVGFGLAGDGPSISDLYLASTVHHARTTGGKGVTGNAVNWRVERLWLAHLNAGIWMSGASHGEIRDCRVRFTYADGINLNRGASFNIVENNHVRGCGDDGIAILAETEAGSPPSTGNTLRGNTVAANWWGHNIDLAGGSDHLVENNFLADNSRAGVLTLNLPAAYPMHPLSDSSIRRNLLVRGGGNAHGQQRGAMWIYPGAATINAVTISENRIVAPLFRGIHLAGTRDQTIGFVRNVVTAPGRDAIHVQTGVRGHGMFIGNSAHALNPGYSGFQNNAGNDYAVTLEDNNL